MRSEPDHLHPVAMLLAAISSVRSWLSLLAFPAFAALFGGGLGNGTLVLLVGMALVVVCVSAVWGVLSWQATSYRVEGGAFHLRRGVIQKTERSIPLEHIQSVDVVQGVIQRLFGVVEVRIETAGAGTAGRGRNAADASLPALSRAAAATLQSELASGRRSAAVATETAQPVPTLRLSVADLLLAGATSGQIGVALPLIATASQLVDDYLPDRLAIKISQTLAPHSVATALILVAVILLLAWLTSIAGTVLAYAGFTLTRDGDNLRIRRGLLERRDVTIPLNRIQAVRTIEGVLRQPFGLLLLRMDSAGYGASAGVSTTLFPLLRKREVHSFLQATAPEFAVSANLHPLPARALRRYIVREALPFLLPAAPLALIIPLARLNYPYALRLPTAIAYGLSLLLAAAYGWLQFRGVGWSYAEDCLVLRSRRLARVTVIAPRRRLQSRSVSQNPFQRRARLATLGVQIASGSGGATLQVVDMDANTASATARQLGPTLATQ